MANIQYYDVILKPVVTEKRRGICENRYLFSFLCEQRTKVRACTRPKTIK